MKKNFPISATGFSSRKLLIGLLSVLSNVIPIGCFFTGASAHATAELDRQFALETIGFLRATDNVDGLFADYVSNAYKNYFSKQSRFVVQDLSRADTALSHSNLPYYKIIQDPEVLAQVARSSHSQTIIRTKVLKEGNQYQFTMEWLHAPKMGQLATQTMTLKEPRDGLSAESNSVQSQIEAALDQMIKKIPWQGHVTGRDGSQVTVNIGASATLHKGDTLVISTLDEAKRHPLLNTIVDWKFTRTGAVELDSVDDSIAFGHVSEEENDRHIARYQKITQIIPVSDDSRFKVITEKNDREQALSEPPHLGFLRATLWGPGGYSREYDAAATSQSRTGGGLFIGAKIDGQLWLTREFFSELGFGYGFWTYGQNPPDQPGSSTLTGSGNVFDFKIAGGYSYLVTGDFLGPKAFAKLGYRSDSYSLPASNAESIGSISFKSLYIGLGGDLPIRNQWGVDLDFGIGVINSVSQSGGFSDGGVNSSSNVSFSLGGYYKLTNRLTIRGALEVLAQSADFTDQSSISQKIITFSPALLYYF